MMDMVIKDSEYSCNRCGYKEQIEESEINIVSKKPYDVKEDIIVVNGNSDAPTIEANCDECGNREAYRKIIPPRWGDEDQLEMYKCTECGHVWRKGFSH
jgi:DNA-directed RNA polymerase subunit M